MPMHDVMTLFPTALVLIGSALAITSWARADGLPRMPVDRRLELWTGAGGNRLLDLTLSLSIVLAGIAAAAA